MTLLQLAMRFVGEIEERPGAADHPFILWCLEACHPITDQPHDEIAWCSAFVSRLAWVQRLPRSKSLAARSWLGIGTAVESSLARAEYDVVILSRGLNPAQGHVGLYAGAETGRILVCGGNQSNGVTIDTFPIARVLGVRRLG